MSNISPSLIKKEYKGQGNFGESKTVPDQSMTLRELLIRYAKGLPLEGSKTPIWEGEEGFDIDPGRISQKRSQDFPRVSGLVNGGRSV